VALADVLDLLCCPHCEGRLEAGDRSVRCPLGHSFDVARQGYVGLLPGDAQTTTGDTAAMVAARETVFDAGVLAPVTEAVAATAEEAAAADGAVVDLGAGTGRHLAAVLDRLPGRAGLALDLSRSALRRAARAHPRIGAASADVWRSLPVRDAVAAVVLCVFAPRNPSEIARILRPGGALVVATPGPDHLRELVDTLGLLRVEPDKDDRLREQLEPALAEVGRCDVERTVLVDRALAAALVQMGPSARHLDSGTVRDRVVDVPDPGEVTLAVRVRTFRVAG